MKQTAVGILYELWCKNKGSLIPEDFQEAKEMEEEQKGYSEEDLKQAFNVGFNVGYNDEASPSYLTFEKWFEQIKKK